MKLLNPVIANDDEHQDALNKTGFWGRKGAGCLFLAEETKRICIAHRSAYVQEPNTWGTWGGAMDAGESPKAGVQREVREETNYHGELQLIPLLVFKHHSGFEYHNFLAVIPEEFKPKMDWENKGFGWFEFGDWPNPLHPGLKNLLDDNLSVARIKRFLK